MARTKFKNVDEYIRSSPKQVQPALKKIRQTLGQALPKAEHVISYNIPCFKLSGRYVIYFAGYEHHISIYPIPNVSPGLKKQIEKHKAGKGTLRFDLDEPLPTEFIKKVARLLAKQRLNK